MKIAFFSVFAFITLALAVVPPQKAVIISMHCVLSALFSILVISWKDYTRAENSRGTYGISLGLDRSPSKKSD